MQTNHIKCEDLISLKKKIKMSAAAVVIGMFIQADDSYEMSFATNFICCFNINICESILMIILLMLPSISPECADLITSC